MPPRAGWTDSVLRAGGRAPFVRIGLLRNSKCLYGLKLELRSHWAYLFKLRQSAGVKRLIERLWQRGDWQSVDQGFDAVEGKLRLTGWSSARRVVVLRRRVKSSLAAEASNENPQPELQFLEGSDKAKLWEYAVLVTNADYSLEAMGQLYRDRADCENGFDELIKT